MKRGDVRWYKFDQPDKNRPVVILTRDSIIPHLGEVTVAPVTSTIRDIPSEVLLDKTDGMPKECAVNCDHMYPGIEQLKIAVMGCVVNGPGESAHADIGISLPGAAEEMSAPVYMDGKKMAVLQGENIREAFIVLLEQYLAGRFGLKN